MRLSAFDPVRRGLALLHWCQELLPGLAKVISLCRWAPHGARPTGRKKPERGVVLILPSGVGEKLVCGSVQVKT